LQIPAKFIKKLLYHRRVDSGEILIVPAGVSNATVWTGEAEFLRLTISPRFLREVVNESIDPNRIELIPQFAAFDPLIHQIGLSLKADLQAGCPTGKIYYNSIPSARPN
jgi:AraC family transcriptional regulator